MSSKTKQTTTQSGTQSGTSNFASTYGYFTPPDTDDIKALRDFQFQSDPRIPYTFGRAHEHLHSSYQNPLGGNTTPQLRDASLRAGDEDIAQQEAEASREDWYGQQGLRFGQQATVAGMTAPRFAQTGGSGTSTGTTSGTSTGVTTQTPGVGEYLMGAAQMGGGLLM